MPRSSLTFRSLELHQGERSSPAACEAEYISAPDPAAKGAPSKILHGGVHTCAPEARAIGQRGESAEPLGAMPGRIALGPMVSPIARLDSQQQSRVAVEQ